MGLLRWLAYHTGILWLTPFVGMIDRSDLEYLRSSIMRDLAWLAVIIKGLAPHDPVRDKLIQVRASLEAIAGLDATDPAARPIAQPVPPVHQPWDVPRGWTDYGAARLAMLAALPPSAWHPATAELRNMKPLVVAGNQAAWDKHLDDVQQQLSHLDEAKHSPDPKVAAWAADTTARMPHELQALWREVDFGRNYWRARIAKQTTTARITWSLVLAATVAVGFSTTYWARGETSSAVPWFVVLCGLLGGSVSALRSLRFTELPERGSLEVEAVKLRLRPVVGAMSAIVLYMVGRSGLVFQIVDGGAQDVSAAVMQIRVGAGHVAWAYYVLGFMAGFSERMFLGVLEAVENRFNRASEAVKPAATTPPTTPPSPTAGATGATGPATGPHIGPSGPTGPVTRPTTGPTGALTGSPSGAVSGPATSITGPVTGAPIGPRPPTGPASGPTGSPTGP